VAGRRLQPGLHRGQLDYIGGLDRIFLSGIGLDSGAARQDGPETVFMCFQMTFAIITPALIAGAFADRMKFSAMLWFMALWSLLVYAPVAHWVWGGGFLGGTGAFSTSPAAPWCTSTPASRASSAPSSSASARATAPRTWRRTTWC
jgi:hypothetical protein